MTSLIQRQLKTIEQSKINLEKEHLKLQKELEKELEKVLILEMEETIDKLKLQVDKLSKNINGKIMPNNIHLVHYQMKKDFKKDLDEFIKLQQGNLLNESDLEARRLSLGQREIDLRKETKRGERGFINGYMELNDNEKLITLKEFKNNLNKVDEETIAAGPLSNKKWSKHLIEIKPEIKLYDEIIPIFNTLISIITKQQEEIDMLKMK